MRPRSLALRALLLLLLLALLATPAAAGTRKALVIGNDRYRWAAALETARADARDVALALERDHFQVTLRLDLEDRAMKEAVRSFKATLHEGDDVVFFFSGHGAQFNASSYLLPVDIQGENEDQVRDDALALQRVLDDFEERKTRFALLIIDACRNNPFQPGHSRGLHGVELAPAMPASGQMVVFSAAAGQEALDRLDDEDHERNGLFTRVLLRAMDEPGVPLDRMVRAIRRQVMERARAVGREQVPTVLDQSVGEFFFREVPPVQASDDPLGRLLEASLPLTPAAAPKAPAAQSHRTHQPAAAHPASHPARAQARTHASVRAGARPGNGARSNPSFRDCPACPRMMIIPAGQYRLGTHAVHVGLGPSAEPSPVVVIREPFAMGQSAVTQGEWRAVMGTNPSFFRNCGDSCPVEQVSWDDAQEFIRRLNLKTGRRYRLPSETEWEYACRSGRGQRYCGSDTLEEVAWYIDNSGPSPHPVGQKRANDFGLEDMSGNVSQWLQDCYHPDYQGVPADGTPWTEASCTRHVVRGGAWLLGPEAGQSTWRGQQPAGMRSNVLGFRLVRALD